MALIKIFPCYSETTERNIQADIVGQVYNLNIYLHDSKSCVDFYLEIPLIGGMVYLRCGSIYDNPYKVEDYLPRTIERITQLYPSRETIISKQIELYAGIWAGMLKGELKDRNYLRNYKLLSIIFGPIIPLEEFHRVWEVLNAKDTAQKLLAMENKAMEEAKKKALMDAAAKEMEFKLVEKVKNNENIDGEDLVQLCKKYGVEMHIKTQGTISRKVTSVNNNICQLHHGTKFKVHPSEYYTVLQERIKDREENPTFDKFWKEYDNGTATQNPV